MPPDSTSGAPSSPIPDPCPPDPVQCPPSTAVCPDPAGTRRPARAKHGQMIAVPAPAGELPGAGGVPGKFRRQRHLPGELRSATRSGRYDVWTSRLDPGNMNAPTQKIEPLRLHHADRDRLILVTPENEDRFVLTCEKAIEGCKLSESRNLVRSDVAKLIERCRTWGHENGDLVRTIYVGPHEARMAVFVVPKTEHFDFELAERVAVLSHELSRAYLVVRPEAIEVLGGGGPGGSGESIDDLRCFVNVEEAGMIYGAPSESPQEVGT